MQQSACVRGRNGDGEAEFGRALVDFRKHLVSLCAPRHASMNSGVSATGVAQKHTSAQSENGIQREFVVDQATSFWLHSGRRC